MSIELYTRKLLLYFQMPAIMFCAWKLEPQTEFAKNWNT